MKMKLLRQILKMSRICLYGIFLQSLFCSLIIAKDGYSQKKSIEEIILTLEIKNLPLNDAFNEISKQTNLNFAYDKIFVNDKQRINIDVENESLGDVLRLMSKDFKIKFKRINGTIHVSPYKQIQYTHDPVVEEIINQQLVSGIVTSVDDGQPLPGVSIIIKGTNKGTTTDLDGHYSLNITTEDVLQFSYIGYNTQEITVGNQSEINISLQTDLEQLEEVVVIGYGEVEKRDVTGAISSIDSEKVTRMNPPQTAKAIQGQVAGVNVRKVDSKPGSGYSIDIRGVHSINYSSEPLVVIDGVMGGDMNTLNPSDIQSIDVLKDASATSIYGARGANGVIIITTKKGKTGTPRVTYDGYTGVKTPKLPDMMTAQEFYRAYNDVVIAENPNANVIWTQQQQANVDEGKSVNWVDEVTDPAIQTSHVIALSGGSETTTHYFSAGYLNEKGNVLHTGYERYSLKGSIESKLNKVVRTGFTTYFMMGKQELGSPETLRSALRARPTGSIYYNELLNPAETNDRDVDGYAMWMGIKDSQVPNPLMEVRPGNFRRETRTSNFLGNGFVELTPLKGLSVKTSLSASVLNERFGQFIGTDAKARLNKLPVANSTNEIKTSYTLDNIINYKVDKGSNQFNLTVGQSALQERYESSGVNVQDLPYYSGWYAFQTAETISAASSQLTERSILSFMGRFNYSFDDKYLLTFTGRYDGSSVLAEGNKWAFFPSIAFAWRAGDEEFIQGLDVFSDLKVRVSYGQVGNDVVSPYSTQAFLAKTSYDFDGDAAYGYAPDNIGNADLKWERSTETNLGLDMGFFDNKISATVELYRKTTDDLIQNVALPTSLGFDAVTANVGKILNKGIEISLSTYNINRENFTWTTNLNFSSNHNEVLELYGGTVTRDIANNLFVGESLNSHYYYEFDGIWQLDEEDEAGEYNQVPGSVKVVDQNNDGAIASSADEALDDRIVLGNELPKWMAGINNMFTYKNWDFSVFVYTRQGVMYRNSMLSGTMGELGSARYNGLNLNYWTEENPTNEYFGVWQSNPYRQAIQYKEANFVRISNITLGYSLSSEALERIHFSKARFYVQADNPFVFVKDKQIWLDPEFNSGSYNDDLPFSTYMIGVNLSF
ncbi:SusC/RagA family TonB-linked outer membrane protein [Chondrinema litorale]|uniref:SusC/RagA family TonB-linked outer membrane protein n=1 Tax=Chondrinema litorale TaxID=2994555 RepID=UPI0025435024|nr:SusC/RagA family TonB-linked outer membrane protein [Chondrinema litorale]UZR98473.1 SusC/RagA family TonB-linked outer membrane protein [Chondrinema litorale]